MCDGVLLFAKYLRSTLSTLSKVAVAGMQERVRRGGPGGTHAQLGVGQ